MLFISVVLIIVLSIVLLFFNFSDTRVHWAKQFKIDAFEASTYK